ncbi:hypothetical protein [Bradyrhizobium sp.]|uniref:hypothetical protein n=1 Tax=Bradyrhizobium sp. TaxID=376 RepID=UPI003C6676D1
MMNHQLPGSIGAADLTACFAYLDGLRERGRTTPYGASKYLRLRWRGMTRAESLAVAAAWRNGFSTLPAADRAITALQSG